MVSTRQMATSASSASSINGNSLNNNHNSMNDEAASTARLSVVTRQSTTTTVTTTSSNINFINCPAQETTAAATTINAQCVGGIAGGSANEPNSSRNHQPQTQALSKTGETNEMYGTAASTSTTTAVELLDLPIEILTQIFSFLEFKRVGQMRVTSKKMNEVCMHILNSTFTKLITKTYNRFQAIKGMMPRRESARRNHPLACECDIIETCYMRLSLLQMTFGKHIERGHCCFFPGAILDEVYTIFSYIQSTPRLERPYRVTDELFDLSTMAMEYFRDRIEPTLPGIANIFKDYFEVPTNTKRPALVITSDLSDSSTSMPSPPQSNMVLRKGIRKIKQGMKIYNNQLSVLRNELSTCKRKSTEQGKQIAEQQKLLAEQQKQTLEYANRLDENDRKNEEMSRKFSTLLQELNKCKTELQYWRSKSPATPICTSCGHKIAPVLPPEDYQALINQGVKPEDIILNLNDDTDAESDVSSISESNSMHNSEFVFPDETTTAKLLAVNTAAKSLKRHHQADDATTSNFLNANTSNSMEKTITTTTIVTSDNVNKNNATFTTNLNAIVCDVGGVRCAGAHEKDLKCRNTADNTIDSAAAVTSYSTKLFYGTQQQQQQHRSVIVTTGCIAAASTSAAAAGAADNAICLKSFGDAASNDRSASGSSSSRNASATINANNPTSTTATNNNNTNTTSSSTTPVANKAEALSKVNTNVSTALNGTASDMCSISNNNNNISNNNHNNSNTTIDATSLQSIAAHETKKARRVQKATRCLATHSGKRSK